MQEYACKKARSKLVKERCIENINILREIQNSLPPKEIRKEDIEIKALCVEHMIKKNSTENANKLLFACAPLLIRIKEKVGKDNAYYIGVSTHIANIALSNTIYELNNLFKIKPGVSAIIRSVNTAWLVLLNISVLDTDSNFKKERYAPNKSALENIKRNNFFSTSHNSPTLDI